MEEMGTLCMVIVFIDDITQNFRPVALHLKSTSMYLDLPDECNLQLLESLDTDAQHAIQSLILDMVGFIGSDTPPLPHLLVKSIEKLPSLRYAKRPLF